MEQEYKLITAEIPVKGIAYLTVTAPEQLREGVERAMAAGADRVLVSGPVGEGEWDGVSLTQAYEMLTLERRLADLPATDGRLRLVEVTDLSRALWLELYNEAFFRVPNGATLTLAGLDELLTAGHTAGLAYLGGQPVGVYLTRTEGGTAELMAMGLGRTMRGKGLGKTLLRQLMERLAGQGCSRCRLTVATANEVAFGLYRSEGFVVAEKGTVWYEVSCG